MMQICHEKTSRIQLTLLTYTLSSGLGEVVGSPAMACNKGRQLSTHPSVNNRTKAASACLQDQSTQTNTVSLT